jgi:hypothetical protein
MHIHIGLLAALIPFLKVVLVGTFWRLAAFSMRANSFGQGMLFMY